MSQLDVPHAMYAFHLVETLWDIPGPQNFLYFSRISLKTQWLGSIFCNRKTFFLWESLEEALYSKHYIKVKFLFKAGRAVKPNTGRMVCGKAEQVKLLFFSLQFAKVESSKQLTDSCFLLWMAKASSCVVIVYLFHFYCSCFIQPWEWSFPEIWVYIIVKQLQDVIQLIGNRM